LLDDHQDGGFKRDWRPATIKPVRHIGYAVQWFALALTVVIIYLVLSFNNPGHQAGERND